jgi:hypothetical protein
MNSARKPPQTAVQNVVQALIGQRAAKDAAHYRVQAERFKAVATSTRLPRVQASCMRIVSLYERLAERAEARATRPPPEHHGAFSGARPEAPSITSDGPADPQMQIAGQDILLAKRSNGDREIASAALLALSRSLCEATFMLSSETREKLRRTQAEMSPPF